MAVNKSTQTRYHVLDKCLANPVKKYFIDDLLKCVNEKLQEIEQLRDATRLLVRFQGLNPNEWGHELEPGSPCIGTV